MRRDKCARESAAAAEKRKRKSSTRRRSFFYCGFFWKQLIFLNWMFHFPFSSSSLLLLFVISPSSSSLSFLSVFSHFSVVFSSSSPLTFSSSSFSSVLLYPLSSFCRRRPLQPQQCLLPAPAAAACVEGVRVKTKKTDNQTGGGRWHHSSFGFGEVWRRRRCSRSSSVTWELLLHSQSAGMTGGRRRKGKKEEGRYFFRTKVSAMFPDFHASQDADASSSSYEFPYRRDCDDKDNSNNDDDADDAAAWIDDWNLPPGGDAESSKIDDNVVEDHHHRPKKGWQVHPKWLEGRWSLLRLSLSSYEDVWWSLTSTQREGLPLMLNSIGAFVLKPHGHVELLEKRKKSEKPSEISEGVVDVPPQGENSHSSSPLPFITSETSDMPPLLPSISPPLFVSNVFPLRWNFTPATRRLIVEWAMVRERLVFRISVQLSWRTQRFVRGRGNGRLRSPEVKDGSDDKSNERGSNGREEQHCCLLQPSSSSSLIVSSSFSPPEHSISSSYSFDFPPYPPPSFSCRPSLHNFFFNVSPIIAMVEIQKMEKDYQRQIVSERKRWWRMADVLIIQIDGVLRGRVPLSSFEKERHSQMKQSIEKKGGVRTDRMVMMIKKKQKMKEDFGKENSRKKDVSQEDEQGKENEKTQKAILPPHLSLEAAVEAALTIPAVLAKLEEAGRTMIETTDIEKKEEINRKGGDWEIQNDLFYKVGLNPQLIRQIIYLPHKQILNLVLQK